MEIILVAIGGDLKVLTKSLPKIMPHIILVAILTYQSL